MGGRGTLYTSYHNPKNMGSDLPSLFGNENDEDTLKSYNGKTEKLKQKHIHIKQSTDRLTEDIFIPNINKVDSLTRKYMNTSEILKQAKTQIRIQSKKLNERTSACFSFNPNNFDYLSIQLNKSDFSRSKENFINSVNQQIDNGYWISADKNERINSTITHEFGHYVQRVLMEKEKQTPEGREDYNNYLKLYNLARNDNQRQQIASAFREKYATKYFKAIQREHRKHFKQEKPVDEIMSTYGKTNDREAFAELFMHLNCSKKPDSLALAMEAFLNKNLNAEDKQHIFKLTNAKKSS